MAQPITCDAHNREHVANVMVTDLDSGDVLAFCSAAYAEFMHGAVAAMDEAEAAAQAATWAAAAAQLEAEATAEAEATDEAAVARIRAVRPPRRGRSPQDSSEPAEAVASSAPAPEAEAVTAEV